MFAGDSAVQAQPPRVEPGRLLLDRPRLIPAVVRDATNAELAEQAANGADTLLEGVTTVPNDSWPVTTR